MKYRPDIDGLRCIAVVPVVLFHMGAPYFSGGYVGVDVFFVISGFLITSVIQRAIEAHEFSIIGFYANRARRLFPAYVFVLAVTLVSVWLTSPPYLVEAAAAGVASSALFVSNFYFSATSGYFDLETHQLHLIHMWSLAVEEQFYLLFPGLLVASRALRRGWLAILLALAAVGSWVLAFLLNDRFPSASYYLIVTRAWELLIGAVVCFLLNRHSEIRHSILNPEIMVAVGVLLIGIGYCLASFTAFRGPAVFGIAPVLGTAFILYFGRYSVLSCRALQFKPFVWIGLISYSLYLWHQPVIVMINELAPDGLPLGATRLTMLVVSVALGWFTWYFIENPIRRSSLAAHKTVLLGAASMLVLAGCSFSLYSSSRLQSVFSSPDYEKLISDIEVSPNRAACHRGYRKELLPKDACELGDLEKDYAVAVIGDSHSVELAFELARLGERVKQYSFGGCFPVALDERISANSVKCGEYHDLVAREVIDDASIEVVVFIFRWMHYFTSELQGHDIRYLLDVAQKLKSQGREVVVVGPVPELPKDVRSVVFRNSSLGQFSLELAPGFEQRDSLLDGLFSSRGFKYFSSIRALCNEGFCPVVLDGQSLYFDQNHLSLKGASVLAPMVLSELKVR